MTDFTTSRSGFSLRRSAAAWACLVIWLTVSCVPGSTPSAPTDPSITSTDTATIPDPTPNQVTVSPTASLGTQITLSVDQSGSAAFQPVDISAKYEAAMEGLPDGVYVLDRSVDGSAGTEELDFVEVLGDSRGSLVAIGQIVRADRLYFDGKETWALAGYPTSTTRYVIGLSERSATTFQVCLEGWDTPSPAGNWLATICTPPDQAQPGSVSIELISLRSRERSLLEIQSHSDRRNADNSIFWVTEDSFIASVGLQDEPCLVRIEEQSMSCAIDLLGKPILAVSSEWMVVRPSVVEAQRIEVISVGCFTNSAECTPVAEIASEELGAALFEWSPNGEKLGVEFGVMLGSTRTRIGFYDATDWDYHELAELPPDHGIVGWCPDGHCMLVSGEATYLVDLDGNITDLGLVLSDPIGLIRVP